MENNKSSTVLVVGATGVLGMEVCRQLAAAGKKVKGLVRISSQKEKVNALHELGVEKCGCDHFDCHLYYLTPGRRFHRNGRSRRPTQCSRSGKCCRSATRGVD